MSGKHADRAGVDDPSFDVVDSRVTHDGMLLTVRVDAVRMPDGAVVDREVVERPDAVAIVPVTNDGEVILVRQYRHAVGRYELEIPAGLLDIDGERPRDAADRELTEETGMAAGRLTEVLHFCNSAGWTGETTTVFVARDLSESTPHEDFEAEAEEADMDVVRLPLDRAVAMVHAGDIRDAKTVIGLLLVAHDGTAAA